MIRLYIIGISILIIAILANAVALQLGLKTWYDVLKMLPELGISAFSKLNISDYFWLCIGYPFTLGGAYWIGDNLFKLLF